MVGEMESFIISNVGKLKYVSGFRTEIINEEFVEQGKNIVYNQRTVREDLPRNNILFKLRKKTASITRNSIANDKFAY
jgi:hypothetical protein